MKKTFTYKPFKIVGIIALLFYIPILGYGQGATCATATTLPTNTTNSCATYTTTATTGGSVCLGGGFGGSGFLNWFRFCTDANATCIELNLTPGTLTGAYSYALYATCGGGLVPNQQGANNCFANGGSSNWRTTGLNLAPNTCYYLAIWTKNSGTFQLCSRKIPPPPNDECAGATQVTSAPTPANNFCYTPNPSDPPPSSFCAVSNENSSWFVFTAQCNGSVTLNLTSITCTGGAGGFQIGFYTGSCNNLTGIGCSSGSGGTVTTTVNNLTAGQTVYILVDGNAGSQCTFNVSATNTTPTVSPPVTICSGQSTTLTATGGTTYQWFIGNTQIGNTASINVSPTATTTYTVVVNNCTATTLTTTVTVNQQVTPQFTQIGPVCPGGTIALPTTSNNGITGTWSPAVNNTATTTYTFTPDTGQCATTATMTVQVTTGATPTFAPVGPICQGQSFSLPTTSTNGYSGTWLPAINTNATTTYTFTPVAGQCATTTTLTVTITPQVAPQFTQVPAICAGGSFSLPTTSNNSITGSWAPAINTNTTTTYTFTPSAGQCATTATMTVTVNQPVTPVFTPIPPVCSGSSFSLPGTSNNSITGTWSPAVNTSATTTYTFTPAAGQCANTATMTVTIQQPVTPSFIPVGPVCAGSSFTLPISSTNSINGSWSPAINNNATTTYTFTPSAGQCATTTTMTVTVQQPVTPTFTQLGPLCQGQSFSLPGTSNNSITGTWSPAINTNATTTYTFTPAAGQCATTATMTVNITPAVIPQFTPIGPLCAGTSFSLPNASNNGITGTWAPFINSNSTTTYTFTPLAGQCATTATMTVTIQQPVVPAFTQIAPICAGGSFTLPTTSNNGIPGSWSPAPDFNNTTTYTFTPAPNTCATNTVMAVTVNQPVDPTFTPIPAICAGGSFTLPATSNNGISGTWSPAINTNVTTTYTFTPAAGDCANTTTLTVNVNQPSTVPTFDPIGPVCQGVPFTLPTLSNNGVPGTWSPAINTNATTTYTFTPAANACALPTTLTVTVNAPVSSLFTQVPNVCSGNSFTLPGTSNNGITGTWSPAINNTTTTTYTFTPAAGQCALSATMTVTIDQRVTPTFPAYGPFCKDAIIPQVMLPNTSNNGINGTWNPGMLSTAVAGNIVYSFTPNAGECAVPVDITVVVNDPVIPQFAQAGPFCSGTNFSLPFNSQNGISGIWSPALNNTATTTYTFTPTIGLCATTVQMTVVIDQPAVPVFTQIPAICQGGTFSLPSVSDDGYSGTWSPAVNTNATTTYTFTPSSGGCVTTAQMTVNVNLPSTVPTFDPVGPVCQGQSFTLPTLSNNGVPGTWSPSPNSNTTTTYTFTPAPNSCALPTTLTVTITNPVASIFTQVPSVCSGNSFTLPASSNNGISGTWSPAIDNTTTTTYTFTPAAGQCALSATMTVTIDQRVTPAFPAYGPFCKDAILPQVMLPNTSNNGINGTWNPGMLSTAVAGNIVYSFTPNAGECAVPVDITVVVNDPVIPQFAQAGPFCSGTNFSLPFNSQNGISGIWSPALSSIATTTYTFTPTNGLCAATVQMTVVIDQPAVPDFTPIPAICQGGTFALPSVSNDGYSGTWSPAINTSATTTYTFTPASGACVTSAQMTVTVNPPSTVPIFSNVGPVCQGEVFTLPAISNNGISGAWSPAPNSNATTTYDFTPAPNSCALPATLTVTVNTPVASLFNQVPDVCSGNSFTLPAISNNGITGVWSPAINNTATTVYTFTPDAGQCASSAGMTVNITQRTAPSFPSYGPYCQNEPQVTLPNVSNNSINGSWNPAVISTSVTGNTIYTFTPGAAECALSSDITVLVNAPAVPQFSQAGPFCSGTNFTLPFNSLNGISGVWSPALNNTSTTTYTFTPTIGLCATTTQMTVTIDQPVDPDFTQVAAICSGGTFTLPTISNNGVAGTWSPAINNTQTTTYNFTPNAGQCANSNTSMTVQVNNPVTPQFTPIGSVCQGASFTLPAVSNEGITGTWTPPVNNSTTTTYNFTPDPGQCANNAATMTVTVSTNIVPTFAQIAPICAGAAAPALPANSLNGIAGTWSPAVVNNVSTATYTFTPSPGQCSNAQVDMTVVVNPNPATPVISAVQPTCTSLGELNITGTPGLTYSVNGGAFSTNLNYGSLQGNAYQVVAQSAAGCLSSAASVNISAPPPVPSIPQVNVTQAGCTTPSILAIAGVPGEQYSLDGGPFTSTLVYNSLASGLHTITAQNSFGCISNITNVNVDPAPTVPVAPNISVQQPTCTAPGAFLINAVAGETYSVDGGAFTNVFNYDPAGQGNHIIIAQNQFGCVSPATTINIQPAPPVPAAPQLNVTQPNCTTPGALSISGTPGETYSLDGGPFTTTLNYNSVASGNHSVVAQNSSGCLSPASVFNITNPPGIPQTPILTVVQPDCSNPTGSFNIFGVAGESYSINGGPFGPALSFTGLAAGTYNVIAQNSTGCISAAAGATIQQPPSIPSTPAVAAVQPTCTGASSITITAVPGETYSLNGAPFSNTLIYNAVAAGNYTIVAQNSSGCVSAPAAVTISPAPGTPQAPAVNAVQPGCTTPGSLSITGVTGELYSVNGGAYSPVLNYNSLAAGNYSVIAQNQAGCISSATVIIINNPPAIPAAPAANAVQPGCTVSVGSFVINAVPGEIYSVNGGSFSSNLNYTSLAPGNYQVIAQNTSGCNSPALTITINNPPPTPSVPQLSATDPGCRATTGSITINGQPGETYSVDGAPYASTLIFGSLAPGNHTVLAQNSFGCISQAANILINDPPPVPPVPQGTATQPGCNTPGSIQISGTVGLQYSLNGGAFSNSLNYTPLASGNYSVVAQNSFGCISDPLDLTITSPPGLPSLPVANAIQPTCTVSTGTININAVQGQTYSINGGAFSTTLNYTNLNPGNYSITATNSSGCITAPVIVAIDPAPVVPPAPAVTSPLTYCQNALVPPLSAGGTGQLLWYSAPAGGIGNPIPPTPSVSVPGSTTYYVSQVSGPCEGPRSSITVRVNIRPELGNPANVDICFNGTLNLNSLYGPGAAWFFNQQRVSDPSRVSQPGIYSIIATNAYGCSDTNTINLIVRPPVIANAGPDDSVQILAPYQLNGSGNGISFTWTPSQLLNDANVAEPIARIKEDTRFVLMVEDDKGCRGFDTMWLRVIYAENVFVPTAFSPNGDGLNDIFRPAPLGGIKELDYFRVYNRFGELIFETQDITEGWNGSYKGRKQDVANYVWVLKGRNKYGVERFLRGNVVLIR